MVCRESGQDAPNQFLVSDVENESERMLISCFSHQPAVPARDLLKFQPNNVSDQETGHIAEQPERSLAGAGGCFYLILSMFDFISSVGSTPILAKPRCESKPEFSRQPSQDMQPPSFRPAPSELALTRL